MSTRQQIGPYQVVTNGNMASTITSPATIKHMVPGINYSVSWTGSPVGTFTVQGSDDYAEYVDGSVKNAGTWNTLPTTPAVTASGAPGNGMIEVVTFCHAIQLVYTATSGTGTLQAIVTGSVL